MRHGIGETVEFLRPTAPAIEERGRGAVFADRRHARLAVWI